MTDKENRRATRRTHNSVVEIYDDSGNAIAETARLVDYSDVGACFSTPKEFAVNQLLRLRLRLLREGRLYIRARIVWAKKEANTIFYGVEFEKVHNVA
jgi:hypothetical protein